MLLPRTLSTHITPSFAFQGTEDDKTIKSLCDFSLLPHLTCTVSALFLQGHCYGRLLFTSQQTSSTETLQKG